MIIKIEDCIDHISRMQVNRKIKLVQNHHTYKPAYNDFTGNNHEKLIQAMEYYHVHVNGWSKIAQHFTTFPDGKISLGRSLELDPAGIYGANTGAICIEHIGNFDAGNDDMSNDQKLTILKLNKYLSDKFMLPLDINHFVYHHWYDLKTGYRTGGTGETKSCPGTAWFTGNSEEDAETFLQLIAGIN